MMIVLEKCGMHLCLLTSSLGTTTQQHEPPVTQFSVRRHDKDVHPDKLGEADTLTTHTSFASIVMARGKTWIIKRQTLSQSKSHEVPQPYFKGLHKKTTAIFSRQVHFQTLPTLASKTKPDTKQRRWHSLTTSSNFHQQHRFLQE